MNPETTKLKRNDEAFNGSTVEHWMLSSPCSTQRARETGINVQTLHQWKHTFKALPAGEVAGTLEALQAESRRLQSVSVPRNMPKTWGIISEPPGSGLVGSKRARTNIPSPSCAKRYG